MHGEAEMRMKMHKTEQKQKVQKNGGIREKAELEKTDHPRMKRRHVAVRIGLTTGTNAAAVGAGTAVGTGFGRDITVRVAFAAGTFAAGVGRCAAVRTGFGSHVTVRIGLAGGALAAAVGVGAAVRAGQ